MAAVSRIARGLVYCITYPNGKRYVGQDRTDDINYFGSAHAPTIARDFTRSQRRRFTVTREILSELRDCSIAELNRCERFWIAKLNTADPQVGYNRTPRGKRVV